MNENIFGNFANWIASSGLVILITIFLTVAGLAASNMLFERMLKTMKLKITDKENLKRVTTISSLGKNIINTSLLP